jgi:hypothetical protein
MVVVRCQHLARSFQGPRGPRQIARHQRDFSQCDRATRAGNRFLAAEGPRSALQQRLGSLEIAKLRHRNAAQGQRRGVVSKGNAPQRPEYVTSCEGTPRGRDQ